MTYESGNQELRRLFEGNSSVFVMPVWARAAGDRSLDKHRLDNDWNSGSIKGRPDLGAVALRNATAPDLGSPTMIVSSLQTT